MSPPGLSDHRIALSPLLLELGEGGECRLLGFGAVDRLRSAISALRLIHATNRVELRFRCTIQVCTTVFGNTASMAWGKALQAIAAHEEDILHATVLELRDHL